MSNDWRFQGSPHVAKGGLRSYAGAQLRCKTLTGETIALGSLCVASNSIQPPLSMQQQGVLVKFADIVVSELVNHSREARKRQRLHMVNILAECRTENLKDTEIQILDIIQQVYPAASVSVQESMDGTILLTRDSSITSINFGDVQDGLWEDVEVIESLIQTQNHSKLETRHVVRAIVCPFRTYLGTRYLVLASNEIQRVFDDVDAGFLESCALLLRQAIQEDRLKEALTAKETFLRGVTHQLRTPIHGVLGSCDLLAEELASHGGLDDATGLSPAPKALTALKTIRDSGRELMSTVNNILRMNRWASGIERSPGPTQLRTLGGLEKDIMYDIYQMLPEHHLSKITIFFENRLPEGTIEVDITLLKECVQALVLNALQFTDGGMVTTCMSMQKSHLVFDILDTGCGIAEADRERIFEAYEKASPYTRGAGLGLTLASSIAKAMDGQVTLVASSHQIGSSGSHFRAEFNSPHFASPTPARLLPALPPNIPPVFHIIPTGVERKGLIPHLANYLGYRGVREVDSPQGALVIVTYTPDADDFQRIIESFNPGQIAMCLLPADVTCSLPRGETNIMMFSGPFITSRLEEILEEVDTLYKRLLPETARTKIPINQKPRESHAATMKTIQNRILQPVALLVDDNNVNLRILRMYCEKRHIPYVTAVDGLEAVDEFNASLKDGKRVNVILMDLQMPVCDGVEATQQIRAIEKEMGLEKSHIFMVTGQDSVSDKSRAFDAGADEYYVKPVSVRSLDRGIGERFPAFKESVAGSTPKRRGQADGM